MNHMNNIRYSLAASLIALTALSLGSCMQEELPVITGQEEVNAVSVDIVMPAPIAADPMTRATASEYDQMDDINIIIGSGSDDASKILSTIFFRFADVTDGQEINGLKITYKDVEMNGTYVRRFKLFFSDEYLSSILDINPRTCVIFGVSNWGSQISVSTVGELRNLKAGSEDNSGILSLPNVMFGQSTDEGIYQIAGTREYYRKLKIGLDRTAAMITVVMDGSNLDAGVIITPKRLALHNVATACTIGKDNSVTTTFGGMTAEAGAWAQDGEAKSGSIWGAGKRLVGNETLSMSAFSDGSCATILGSHYPKDAESKVTDLSDLNVHPLFLYENMHGASFGATGITIADQHLKRPAGVAGTMDAISKFAATGVCSYIEIEADYIQYDAGMSILQKGTASWRFFLGGNATDDFDIRRNTNYQLTLRLAKTGIGEYDYSWRVDGEIKKPILVGDEDMVVGGGGEAFCAEFIDPSLLNQNMKIVQTGGDFVYAYAAPDGSGKNYQWLAVNTAGNKAWKWYTTADKQIWFYVAPLLPDETPLDVTERKCTLSFQPNGVEGQDVTISFTQYRPVTVQLGWDDVKDAVEGTDIYNLKKFIEANFNYTFKAGDPDGKFYFYVDQHDRDEMPWGFSGVVLKKNHGTGFENVYHLIDPQPNETNCAAHVDYAKHYLPTGKGFRETGSDYIDYSNGSCMMHAAMENYFQKYYPKPADNIKPDDILRTTLPGRPLTPDYDPSEGRAYGWCVPSITGWQMIEKVERYLKTKGITLFEKYPLDEFESYWTSDAETIEFEGSDGKTNAFVYQYGVGLDNVDNIMNYPSYLKLPRSTALKYRLINIPPKFLK